jgi:hypothetical protein
MTRLSDHFVGGANTEWELELQCDVKHHPQPQRLNFRHYGHHEASVTLFTGPPDDSAGACAIVASADLLSFLKRVVSMLEQDVRAYADTDEPTRPYWAQHEADAFVDRNEAKAGP